MTQVRVVLPRMLADLLGGENFQVQAKTVEDALEALYAQIPQLRHHLLDESGTFRTHVLCVHNGTSTRESGGLRRRVSEGDEIRIIQAISGG